MDDEKNKKIPLSSVILENLEDEAGAQDKYYQLVANYKDELDDSDIEQIFEIIGDEAQHLLKLHLMALKYSSKVASPGVTIASDGTKEVMAGLIDKINVGS